MSEDGISRRLAAIVLADIVGYSRMMEADETGMLTRLIALRAEVIDAKIGEHRGRVVKSTGDGVLAEFASVTDAVQACIEIQKIVAERGRDEPEDKRIRLRVGVNLGEIITEGDDIYGTGVNIAARLEALAEPGGICISGSVYDQIHAIMNLNIQELGEAQVKNISTPVRSYAVRSGEAVPRAVSPSAAPAAMEKPKKPTIAVLPFENLSGDPEQEFFADGIAEDILTALSKNRWFLVSARSAVFALKGRTSDTRQMAQELRADFVLVGTVRKAGNRVRISAELIDGQEGIQLWAERYDRTLEDIFEVQDEITSTIAARIEPEIGALARERVKERPTRDLDTWQTYHLATSHVYRYTKEGNAQAERLYRQVVEANPGFAAAHAGVAYALFLGNVYFGAPMEEERLAEMLSFADRAVALDDKDANSHFIRGRIRLIRREYDLSISDLRTAVELNPTMATAYCGLADSLSYSGRMAEAIPQFEEAIRLSPHDPRKWAFLTYGSLALMLLERHDEAVQWAADAAAVPNATFWPFAQLVAAYVRAGRPADANTAAAALMEKQPDFSSGSFAKQFLFYHEDPEQTERYSEALTAAGLPH